MGRWLAIILRALWSTARTQIELALENLALRQQLAVCKAGQPRPRLTEVDRVFCVCLSKLWTGWGHSLLVVRPQTVIGWHGHGFRRYWAWKSRRRCGRPAISAELRDLIRRMSRANPLWGAPRIHGELLKLGERFSRQARKLDIDEVIIAPRSPWQNAYVERVIGSIRRECLDHLVVLGERHLGRVLGKYAEYYNRSRTHLSLAKDAPTPRSVQGPSEGKVIEVPRVGGLHHEYTRRAA